MSTKPEKGITMKNDNAETNHQLSPTEGKRSAEFGNEVEGVGDVSVRAATQQAWLMRRLICLGGMLGAFAWLFIGNMDVLACGYWGSLEGTVGNSVPNPGSGSDSGNGWEWSWSLGPSDGNGSYSGSASSSHGDWRPGGHTSDTAIKTATGWRQSKVKSWTSGGPGHHGPPGNARVVAQGDGKVSAQVTMNANNGDISTGSCAGLGSGKIIFSGVVAGTVEVKLDCQYTEGATEISGTLSSTPSIEYTTTCDGGIADAQGVNTISITDDYDGMIAGKLEKGYGACSVRAKTANSALLTTAVASTEIETLSLSIAYGGSGGPCSGFENNPGCPELHHH